MKVSESFSMPLVALTMGASCGTLRATSFATSRVAWLGATKTTIVAWCSTSSGSTLAVRVPGSLALGRYLPFTCSSLICVTRSARRQYICTESPLSARTFASAVPHAPAPRTATLFPTTDALVMAPRYQSPC